eukprot:TRINITY_DN46827_c0_g1_i1.p1 TRINITY_DN46827_c0_g1~~TRINITY_DN46827_c0_g1_i1.p1  ORF type:complete len:228 (+),score=57.11 TRINITY_DN46827_c0_g1_i1:72-686(+)
MAGAPGTTTLTIAGLFSALAGLGGYLKGSFTPELPRAVYEWPAHVNEDILMQIPAGAEPGELLMITKPDGTEVAWTVPENMKAHDVISLDNMQKAFPKSLYVTVADDAASGESLRVVKPDGNVAVVELPSGAAAGERIVLETYNEDGEGWLLFKILPYAAVLELLLAIYVMFACFVWKHNGDESHAEGGKADAKADAKAEAKKK